MKKRHVSDIKVCWQKIAELLVEYNCTIEIDDELLGDCILVDQDTMEFEKLALATVNKK